MKKLLERLACFIGGHDFDAPRVYYSYGNPVMTKTCLWCGHTKRARCIQNHPPLAIEYRPKAKFFKLRFVRLKPLEPIG